MWRAQAGEPHGSLFKEMNIIECAMFNFVTEKDRIVQHRIKYGNAQATRNSGIVYERKGKNHKNEVLLGGNLIDKHLVMISWKDSTLHSC